MWVRNWQVLGLCSTPAAEKYRPWQFGAAVKPRPRPDGPPPAVNGHPGINSWAPLLRELQLNPHGLGRLSDSQRQRGGLA